MKTASPRSGSFKRYTCAAVLVFAALSGAAHAETAPTVAVRAAAVPKAAATSAAVLNASAKVTSGKPVRVRHTPLRTASRPASAVQTCSWFWCGRRQVSWLVLGVGF